MLGFIGRQLGITSTALLEGSAKKQGQLRICAGAGTYIRVAAWVVWRLASELGLGGIHLCAA